MILNIIYSVLILLSFVFLWSKTNLTNLILYISTVVGILVCEFIGGVGIGWDVVTVVAWCVCIGIAFFRILLLPKRSLDKNA